MSARGIAVSTPNRRESACYRSPAVRTLLQERVRELDDAEQLSRAEEWQRAQAWSTWDKIKAGDVAEVSKADLDAEFEEARSRRQR